MMLDIRRVLIYVAVDDAFLRVHCFLRTTKSRLKGGSGDLGFFLQQRKAFAAMASQAC
ncbi:hypothetical protein [Xanthomonas tesorieronis]|uniref:hypothetical protein n=1 Tax=Xanthomonas tesorieronis TaxID=3160839 RepID=UPI003511B115